MMAGAAPGLGEQKGFRCCGFSVIISKSHTSLLRHITAEVFSPLTLMADFHRPHLLLGVCFSWQGQSPLPCFRELFNYKSSTPPLAPPPPLLLSPAYVLPCQAQ